MTYQFNPDMLPDSRFQPGHLKYVVPGNEGRWLDPRRTPLRVIDVKRTSGFFVIEILDFEDKGASWEVPLERVDRCQFAEGSIEAGPDEVAVYAEIITRLDRPLEVRADSDRRRSSEATIVQLREDIRTWMSRDSAFIASGITLDLSGNIGHPLLWADLEHYMTTHDLWEMESALAEQYVRNPHSGELVKGHRIVLAELGFVSFVGTEVRDPRLFADAWRKARRARHILHRLAFVRELFERIGHKSVTLYRGFSCEGPPAVRNLSFTSATFSLDVAASHFHSHNPNATTSVLIRQTVPIERLFMSFLETSQMNQQYKEAEAALLYDEANSLF